MKLTYEQLSQSLQAKKLSPVYLISGDVPLLIQETLDIIRQLAKEQGFITRKSYSAAVGIDWEDLQTTVTSYSLFTEKQIIELHFNTSTLNESLAKQVQHLLASLNADLILLLVFPKLDAKTQKSKWLQEIEQRGIVTAIWPIETQQLPGWLRQRMKQTHLSTSETGLRLLADATEGNLLAAAQIITQLFACYGAGQLSTEQIAELLADHARFDIFQLAEQCLLGNINKALRILHHLKQVNTEATLVLWALARESRLAIQLHAALNQGKSFDAFCRENAIWDKRKPAIKAISQRYAKIDWKLLFKKLGDIDLQIKGIKSGDCWMTFEQICIVFSGAGALIHE